MRQQGMLRGKDQGVHRGKEGRIGGTVQRGLHRCRTRTGQLRGDRGERGERGGGGPIQRGVQGLPALRCAPRHPARQRGAGGWRCLLQSGLPTRQTSRLPPANGSGVRRAGCANTARPRGKRGQNR